MVLSTDFPRPGLQCQNQGDPLLSQGCSLARSSCTVGQLTCCECYSRSDHVQTADVAYVYKRHPWSGLRTPEAADLRPAMSWASPEQPHHILPSQLSSDEICSQDNSSERLQGTGPKAWPTGTCLLSPGRTGGAWHPRATSAPHLPLQIKGNSHKQ